MKRILVMALLASTMALVTGCDFFRRLADRPTSDEIEAKRQYIEREETLHQRRLDSLKLVQQHVSDSLAVLDSLKNSKNNMVSSQRMGALSSGTMETRYCIVVGSFTNRDNARDRHGCGLSASRSVLCERIHSSRDMPVEYTDGGLCIT